ncbi:aspartate aminotransferase [Vagococcus penaei]|uniref:Aminotransferase n=1 Tax=Vagococcus penaei TaxID=633807 RepID=A0A1Q2D3R9_9ENTE|nr:pyridoxal phosphate-dependent aminotransferase [Vagococcus penaei]AQP53040.1 aspartate aminotransferase [Vagococcus penaei]RSU06097.1 aspartate aminotransferase [Vagococcus penaei]
MEIAKRVSQIKPSATLAAAAKARELQSQGIDVLSLTIGEPDFQTPENIKKAAIKSIEDGRASFYTAATGIQELVAAIQHRTQLDYGVTYESDEIVIGTGAKFILYALFQSILNPQDEVIIPTPYWVSYEAQVELAEGTPVFVETSLENNYKVTVVELEAALTEKTKAVIINTPSNPTGMVYSYDELKAIGEWAVEKNILIIADDIYGKLVYNGHRFTPIVSISDAIRRQTIVVTGVSKSYSMTGWRVGYAMGDAGVLKQMGKLISQSTSNLTTVCQYAAVEALTGNQSSIEQMRLAFEDRLNTIYPLIETIPGIKIIKPHGAFYLYPDVSETVKLCGYQTVSAWVDDLLAEAHVAVVLGAGFGTPNNIRLSYATDMATLKEAVSRIHQFVEQKINNR